MIVVNQISLISSLFALYILLAVCFFTMLIHLMPKYLRSLISVQNACHITHGETMSNQIKRLAVGVVWTRSRGCLGPVSVDLLGFTVKFERDFNDIMRGSVCLMV